MNAQVISSTDFIFKARDHNRIPNFVVYVIVGISIAPFLMNLMGIDFASKSLPFDDIILSGQAIPNATDAAFHHLAGAFTHTLLEWSAVCVAIFTVFLAFNHYYITRELTTPIIGMALVCAGFMDAFHTLAADRLISAVADNRNLIPFTWAICRVFNALILIVGICLLLRKKQEKLPTRLSFLVTTSLIFGITAYAIIHYSATSSNLPQTIFPDNLITRPWDFGPLLLYLFCGLYLFPLYYRRYPSIFAHGLIISIIPDVATEAHMAFGSTALFDAHFNIAHFLKIVAYLVPLIGLVMDYSATQRKQQVTLDNLDKANADLTKIRRKLSYLLQASPAVIYSMNLSPKYKGTFISENITALMEYSPAELLADDFWCNHIHVNDIQATLEQFHKLIKQKKQNITLEYRFKHRLGHYLWVHDVITVTYDYSGQPLASIGSWTDISELKTKEADLIRVNQELDEFTHIASHDLKEPLRGIHNYSNFLLEDYSEKLDDEGRSKLETLVRLTKRMEDLINALLNFSHLGRTELTSQNTNLNDLLAGVIDTLHIGLKTQNIEVRIPRALPYVVCDSALIDRVLSNLISNAMKYSDKPDKWIEIGYQNSWEIGKHSPKSNPHPEQPNDPVIFYVRDNGIGINEKHLESIFRIFKRLHGKNKYGGGTGIGLTIVKKIVEHHRGRLWVDSRYGEGSTFYFTLFGEKPYDP